MSRSNPNVNAPNPAQLWYEWNGEKGLIRYYDKTAKANIDVNLPFTFLVLDELASVRGWHDASDSGIYSNEVRDTTKDVLVVKSFKGGQIAEGYYKAIKDSVKAEGGQFVANCYVAVKTPEGLSICSLRFKGSALGAWMEFRKEHRHALYEKAVSITGFTEGKKGRIIFRVPTFELRDVSQETNTQATVLDKALQKFLSSYLQKKTKDQADEHEDELDEQEQFDHELEPNGSGSQTLTDDDIPFSWVLPLLAPIAGALLAAHAFLA